MKEERSTAGPAFGEVIENRGSPGKSIESKPIEKSIPPEALNPSNENSGKSEGCQSWSEASFVGAEAEAHQSVPGLSCEEGGVNENRESSADRSPGEPEPNFTASVLRKTLSGY